MNALIQLVSEYVAAKAGHLDATYRWPIPTTLPHCAFERAEDSLAAANMRLKRALAAAWRDRPDDREALAHWYVATWGGVRANRAGTIRAYVEASEEELIGRGTAGIASWSKILVVRDPERFAIYDARVAVALNALQIARGIESSKLFPKVPSRNKTIVKFQAWGASAISRAHRLPKSDAYRWYLDLLRAVAARLALPSVDTVEMTLFADAEALAKDVLPSRAAA